MTQWNDPFKNLLRSIEINNKITIWRYFLYFANIFRGFGAKN